VGEELQVAWRMNSIPSPIFPGPERTHAPCPQLVYMLGPKQESHADIYAPMVWILILLLMQVDREMQLAGPLAAA
jgi:hypothetical protein